MRPMMAAEEERPHTRHKMVFGGDSGSDAMTRDFTYVPADTDRRERRNLESFII